VCMGGDGGGVCMGGGDGGVCGGPLSAYYDCRAVRLLHITAACSK